MVVKTSTKQHKFVANSWLGEVNIIFLEINIPAQEALTFQNSKQTANLNQGGLYQTIFKPRKIY